MSEAIFSLSWCSSSLFLLQDISIPVLFLRVGVEFRLECPVGITSNIFFPSGFKLPPSLAVEVTPYARIKATMSAYVSFFIIRAGVYGQGTLADLSSPLRISYNENYGQNKWCFGVRSKVIAMALEAGVFYQWKSCRFRWCCWIKCDWGRRHYLLRFHGSGAFSRDWLEYRNCF